MIRTRLLASLLFSATIAVSTSACATGLTRQDEVVRTAPMDRVEATAGRSSTAQTFDAISGFLDEAAAAWSSGDVEAVMATYVEDEPLLVFMGDLPLKGPDAVRAALEARAASSGLGTMSYEWFETLQFDVNTAVASGRVLLAREGQVHRGLFTRVLRRTDKGWRIVHDQLAWGPDA